MSKTEKLPSNFIEVKDIRGPIYMLNPHKITGAVFMEGGAGWWEGESMNLVNYPVTKIYFGEKEILTKQKFEITKSEN